MDALTKDMNQGVVLGEAVWKLKYNNRSQTWVVNNQFEGKNIVNTVWWNDLQNVLEDIPASLENSFEKIKYNRIVVSLYEQEYEHDWHWRYIPDIQKAYHREFFIHNFAESSKENGVYLETNRKRWEKGKVSKCRCFDV